MRWSEEVRYRRELVMLPDRVRIALDWLEDPSTMEDTTPLVVCLHGMGGEEVLSPMVAHNECVISPAVCRRQ